VTADDTSIFVPTDSGYRPTGFARGPWDPLQLHGGAVNALFAEVLVDGLDASFHPARLTVDLVRPVPLDDLDIQVETTRQGNRLVAKRAVICCRGKAVAAASFLALRAIPVDNGEGNVSAPPSDTPDNAMDRWGQSRETEAFLGGAITVRFAAASDASSAAWVHLHRRVLPDRPTSPFAQAASAADITSVATTFEGTRYNSVGFLNADMSLHLHRLPSDGWLRIASLSRWEPSGIGTVTARLADRHGTCGQVTQALLLARGLTPP